MILAIIWLITNLIGTVVVSYAVWDAWKDYVISIRENGWVEVAARAELRSQLFRLSKTLLLLSVAIFAMVWPTPPVVHEYRPLIVTNYVRLALTAVVVIMTLDSTMSLLSKRKILSQSH